MPLTLALTLTLAFVGLEREQLGDDKVALTHDLNHYTKLNLYHNTNTKTNINTNTNTTTNTNINTRTSYLSP